MGVQPVQPGPAREGLDHGVDGALVAQRDAELGGRGGGAHRTDGSRTDLRVHPQSDGPGGLPAGQQAVDAGHLLEVVQVDRDAVGQGELQLLDGLGGAVEHQPVVGESGRQRLFQLSGRGHFAAHARLREQPQHRHQPARLRRERVLHRGGSLERLVQRVDGGEHTVDVEETDQGRSRAQQAVLDRPCERGLTGGAALVEGTGSHCTTLQRCRSCTALVGAAGRSASYSFAPPSPARLRAARPRSGQLPVRQDS